MKLISNIYLLLLITFTISGIDCGEQPNIVFIMADDMGWNDVSFHGSDQIQTPNIDILAYQGIILQQFYSEAICTPARSALLTGKYPMRLGMHGFPLYNSEDRGIPVTERLLPSYLKELGYATHLVGKWHVGMSREEYLPTARGYDTHYGMRGGFVDYYTYNKIESWPDGRTMYGLDFFDEDVPQETEQQYIVDALTDRAVEIIQGHNTSKPLFLHLTHNAPHAGNAGGALQPPLYSTIKNKHIANSDRRLYAEIVTYLDKSIGRVVRTLNERNILDNTIIIFMSDNGGPTVGPLRNWSVNLPFRGKKSTPWEGGVRVPAFIWHSSFKPRIWDGLIHITDWLPTLIAAAGGTLDEAIDGVNQWDSIVRNGLSNRKEVLISVENGENNVYAAYRAGDYKVIVGNVTGLSNGYYGADLMTDRTQPPDYFGSLRTCEVTTIFENLGMYLDYDEIVRMRRSAVIVQNDQNPDEIPCEPTPNRGCLFNVREDPMESHDLWQRANRIAVMLTSRLRALWAMQEARGATRLQSQADPANFNYNWTPWVNSLDIQPHTDSIDDNSLRTSRLLRNNMLNKSTVTKAVLVNCDETNRFRNFLCILRSIF